MEETRKFIEENYKRSENEYWDIDERLIIAKKYLIQYQQTVESLERSKIEADNLRGKYAIMLDEINNI